MKPAARVDHPAQRALAHEAELLVQRGRRGVVRVDGDEAILVAKLLEIIFEHEERGLRRVAAAAVLGGDAQAVAEDASVRVAVVRVYLSDRLRGRVFDDPSKGVAF